MKTNKKIFAIMALALMGLVAPTKLKAQDAKTKADNGQWFHFDSKEYIVIMDDVNDIALLSDQGNLVNGKLYKTRSGMKFYTKYSEQWRARMLAILTKVTGSPVTSLVTGFSGASILPWDQNITIKTKNYYINNGVEGFNRNFTGGTGIRTVVVNGYPVLKVAEPCFNPNDPEVEKTEPVFVTKPNVPSAVPPHVVPAPRDTIKQVVQQVCPCSTYVACTNCFESYPVSSVSGLSFNQYYQLNSMSHGQLPTSSNDRYGSFHGPYGNMYTSIGQTPGYQNAVYSATSGQQMIWAYAGYSSPQCCVQQVAVNPCPCGQAIQPCPCAQQPAPAPASAPTVKPKRRCGGWIVAGVIATGVIVYAILTGKKTDQNSGGPGTQGGVLPTGGPGTQGG